jgi:dienelactone hydrolase
MRSFSVCFSIISGFAVTLVFLACVTVPVKSTLSEADTGKVGFESLTIDEGAFLGGSKHGSPVTISGELRIPARQGKVPAVILTHGSGGIGGTETGWARELNKMGLATFIVDSFTGRNLSETGTGRSQLSTGSSVIDVYRALMLLRTHPKIDSSRICLMGFSRGGRVVLWAAMKRFQDLWLPPDCSFAGYLAFYPAILAELQGQAEIGDRPIRVFQGTADDWTVAEKAHDYVESLRKSGRDARILEYRDARHAFDNHELPPAQYLSYALNPKKCAFAETPSGRIIDQNTGERYSSGASCFGRGATVGYNAQAYRQAVKDVHDFLRSALGPGVIP